MSRLSSAYWLVLALGLGTLAAPTVAQDTARHNQTASLDGAGLFKTWCASCHGMTAQGNGALAPMLRRVPPDLTLIAAKNGGMFPAARIRRIVDGREVESHGDPDMPVWGSAFKSAKDGYSDESVRARIDAVVAYLESIQRRNAH